MTNQSVKDCSHEELRVAFDLDAVLFSAESEIHYKQGGLKAFFKHEKANADKLVGEVSCLPNILVWIHGKWFYNLDIFSDVQEQLWSC